MDAAEARRSSASSSPEFEFWPLHPNPAASPSCADELFAGGVLLPLPVLPPKPASSHSGRSSNQGVPAPEPEPETELAEASILATVAPPTASITSPAPPATASTGGSKRWTDIFSKKTAEEKEKEKEKEKRKDGAGSRKQAAHGGGGGAGAGSELNINIWPFSRSRSAGGGGSGSSKPRPAARKVSSAPCSRSNSRGEAAGAPPRRWAASPGRAGVPVGRSSPVWQIRRPAAKPAPAPSASELPFVDRRAPAPQTHKEKPGSATAAAAGRKPGLSGGVRGLNLSVNSCIGYRHQVSCRRADVGAARGPGGGGLFGIKGFFSKKVH
ncbi:hypothetical protein GQ55_8G162000 [Panicum hallii var. hallii]|jgi:hypothetical protein|uniref:Uncharacterized protein n=2 Tax=Panicum hallii TaxID=206008 RepID=A0A2T7CND5_9POAL|nr:uncharacterized protein LOC112903718 [Panicum hallii]PAN42530.1 hypothetical protein PAHAL_8G162800 [Panicum hallii]PUZ44836.1 hypothetical protein GQ55_8G162000 [Panicum hallii var. hallii]